VPASGEDSKKYGLLKSGRKNSSNIFMLHGLMEHITSDSQTGECQVSGCHSSQKRMILHANRSFVHSCMKFRFRYFRELANLNYHTLKYRMVDRDVVL
jgi:hypothetical protein